MVLHAVTTALLVFCVGATTQSQAATGVVSTAKSPELQRRFEAALKLANQKRGAEAIEQFRKLADEYPNVPELQNNLAVLYAERGDLDKAQAALETALHGRSSYDTIYRNLGNLNARRAAKAYAVALNLDTSKTPPAPLALLTELGEPWDPVVAAVRVEATAQKVGPGSLASSGLVGYAAPASAPASARASTGTVTASAAAAVTATATAQASAAALKPTPTTAPATQVATAAAPRAAPASVPAAVSAPSAVPVVKPAAAAAPPAPVAPVAVAAVASKPAATVAAAAASLAATKPAAAATAVATPVPDKARDNAAEEAKIRKAVQAWANAWESKNLSAYVDAYTPGFKGAEASPAAWQAARRVRILGKKSIDVKVSSVVVSMSRTQTSATFTQAYTADQLKLVSRKTLTFELRDGRWLITRESATTSRA